MLKSNVSLWIHHDYHLLVPRDHHSDEKNDGVFLSWKQNTKNPSSHTHEKGFL